MNKRLISGNQRNEDWWRSYALSEYDHARFQRGKMVLDLGCGQGDQLNGLREKGCRAFGLDPRKEALKTARQRKLPVVVGKAEALPFRNECFHGILCKGVLPFTDETLTLTEINRVMQSNGELDLISLGFGYYLRYAWEGTDLKARVYGLRTILNTWVYALCGKKLPGFIGDTTYQSTGRMDRKLRRIGLELIETSAAPRFGRFPVFIYQRLRKVQPLPE